MKHIILYSVWYLVYAIGCQISYTGPYTFEECKAKAEEIKQENPVYVYCTREEK
jgi:hypothetical protein